MSFYDPFKAIPQVFVDLGALVPITLTRAQANTFDPKALGSPTPGSQTVINGHGVLSVRRTRADDGTIVSTTIAKLTVEPRTHDKLTIGGTVYVIGETTTIAPDGEPIFFEAVVS